MSVVNRALLSAEALRKLDSGEEMHPSQVLAALDSSTSLEPSRPEIAALRSEVIEAAKVFREALRDEDADIWSEHNALIAAVDALNKVQP